MADPIDPMKFEIEAINDLRDSVPSGWRVLDTPPSSGFDVIVKSPEGNLFPIEVKTGSGRLDPSTVVRFGHAVETSSLSGDLTTYVLKQDPHKLSKSELIGRKAWVKPIIYTTQSSSEAAEDYAKQFHVEVVKAQPTLEVKTPSIEPPLESRPRVKATEALLSCIRDWNRRIVNTPIAQAQSRKLVEWFELKEKT
jgi:hypothetical protein